MDEITLKFDKMDIDTQLAETFLNQHKNKIDMILASKEEVDLTDIFGGRLDAHGNPYEGPKDASVFRKVAEKIEQNIELFAQLEFLKRGVPKEDTYRDIKLIVQNFNLSSYVHNYSMHPGVKITMGDKTPLWYLGPFAQDALYEHNTSVICCETTAPICYLFGVLVSEAHPGLHLDSFYYKKMIDHKDSEFDGCVGVITEKSDLESAVDIFITSSTSKLKHPWTLRRILVQESVYETFKKALSSTNGRQSTEAPSDVASLSSDVFNYEEKLLLLDYAGSENKINDTKQVILVEAYRTIKELISMLANYQPFTLSLWCSDISEANEIAYGVNVPITWINDYKNFDGQTISRALYSRIHRVYLDIDGDDMNKIQKAKENWSKMSVKQRLEIFEEVTEEFKTREHENKEVVPIIERALLSIHEQRNKFLEVEKRKIWVEIEQPNSVTYRNISLDYHVIEKIIRASILHGNVLLHRLRKKDGNKENIFYHFEQAGIPVFDADKLKFNYKTEPKTKRSIKASSWLYESRIICTTFGSIFAN